MFELYSFLKGSKQPPRAGKTSTEHHKQISIASQTKFKMLSFSYCDQEDEMRSELGRKFCFIIYRTVERKRNSDVLLTGHFIFE